MGAFCPAAGCKPGQRGALQAEAAFRGATGGGAANCAAPEGNAGNRAQALGDRM